jgi:carbonic anhydrase
VRIAGNVVSPNVLASMEYGCAVAGAKLILVMGHTSCGAVTAAIDLTCSGSNPEQATGCQHLEHIVSQIQHVVDAPSCQRFKGADKAVVDEVARRNVLRIVQQVILQSRTIRRLVAEGRIALAGAMYDVAAGKIDIISGPIDAEQLKSLSLDGEITSDIHLAKSITQANGS